ncbi:SCO4983 family protein [Streptomyces cavernicola]|uniref:Uncharacterized protein n=1 Tax=Streptomyces cavernicola TaxID=3043613 RepID=A0ABT6SJK9_9ACTN|nr:hypothetical protein [Streptomyces sp. B-S-A6]MDI3408064.1 hypothetical protein [Streptomyces sp. B-S-A6]
MYEPIRSKSVHTMAARGRDRRQDFPHRSREEELDIQLAGHLAALLAVTDELRAVAPATELTDAAEQLARQIARLRGGHPPVRSAVAAAIHEPHLSGLHQRAHALAGRALVVAASRADTAAAILAAERMDAHEAALREREPAAAH